MGEGEQGRVDMGRGTWTAAGHEGYPMMGRRRRRGLVVAVYVGYVALAVAWAVGWGVWPAWGVWSVNAVTVFIAAALVGESVLRWAVRRAADIADKRADERQRAVRDRAHRIAYRVVVYLSLAAILYLTLAYRPGGLWFPATLDGAWSVIWGLYLLMFSLPSAVIAWTDPEAEE